MKWTRAKANPQNLHIINFFKRDFFVLFYLSFCFFCLVEGIHTISKSILVYLPSKVFLKMWMTKKASGKKTIFKGGHYAHYSGKSVILLFFVLNVSVVSFMSGMKISRYIQWRYQRFHLYDIKLYQQIGMTLTNSYWVKEDRHKKAYGLFH